MKTDIYRNCALWLTLAIASISSTTIGQEENPGFFTFTFENDTFVGEDNGYTNGIGITFGKGNFSEFNNETLPNLQHALTKGLYICKMENKTRGVANMFFQRMQTPTDLSKSELIKDDLPYAGLLAWQSIMYAWDEKISDQFSITLGAVGPISFADEAQKFVHELIGAEEPMGWDNQLDNELVIKIELQRVWNLHRSSGEKFQYDVLALAGAGFGNLESATKAGLALRWGTKLSTSFSSFQLQATRQVNPLAFSSENNFYLFAGARAGYVFNDIFMNGNTFENSHSVPLENFQEEYSGGLVWNIGRCAYVFQLSSRSSPTGLLNDRENFGAMSLTFRY